jgi:hypothetical protein
MSKYAGQFEYVSPGTGVEQAGACEFSFDERTATLVPAEGSPLAFDLGDIDTLEAGEWDVRLTLYSGPTLTLRRFGKALSDFARELLDAYRGRLVQCLLVSDLNEVARFNARVQLQSPDRACAGPAEIRLYESNLAVLPDAAAGFQWRLADLAPVEFDETNYAVVFVCGRAADRRPPREADGRAGRASAGPHRRSQRTHRSHTSRAVPVPRAGPVQAGGQSAA